jgi:hypothetical protein
LRMRNGKSGIIFKCECDSRFYLTPRQDACTCSLTERVL